MDKYFLEKTKKLNGAFVIPKKIKYLYFHSK